MTEIETKRTRKKKAPRIAESLERVGHLTKTMSLRYEQQYSLYKTRKFLRDLMVSSTRPKTVAEMKKRAYSCLRHFPMLDETGAPMFSKDPFECPEIKEIDDFK